MRPTIASSPPPAEGESASARPSSRVRITRSSPRHHWYANTAMNARDPAQIRIRIVVSADPDCACAPWSRVQLTLVPSPEPLLFFFLFDQPHHGDDFVFA